MANFNITYDKWIKPIEGGYSNNPADIGGETYAGIARKFWPTLNVIWSFIDKVKATKGPIKNNAKFPELDAPARAFYQDMFVKNGFDKINNQNIADILFDWFVNSGSNAFYTKAAETFGVDEILNNQFGQKLPLDSKLDAATIAAINKVDAVNLYEAIKQARIGFYKRIVAVNPSQQTFYQGWMNRINAFPTLAKVGAGIGTVLLLAGLFFLGYNVLSNGRSESE